MENTIKCKIEPYPEGSTEEGLRIKNPMGGFIGKIVEDVRGYVAQVYDPKLKQFLVIPLYAVHGVLKEVMIREGNIIKKQDIVF